MQEQDWHGEKRKESGARGWKKTIRPEEAERKRNGGRRWWQVRRRASVMRALWITLQYGMGGQWQSLQQTVAMRHCAKASGIRRGVYNEIGCGCMVDKR